MSSRIAGLTVCVNYADYLARVLPVWTATLDTMLVVTAPRDQATLALCASTRTPVYKTDAFFAHGAVFNKGGAMDEALARLAPVDWVVLFDADIVPPEDWRTRLSQIRLAPGHLYGPRRVDEHGARIDDVKTDMPGFFHLFHIDDPAVRRRPLFGDWHNASGYDTAFAQRWDRTQWRDLPFEVVHLGEPCTNWCGRGNAAGLRAMHAMRARLGGWEHERISGEGGESKPMPLVHERIEDVALPATSPSVADREGIWPKLTSDAVVLPSGGRALVRTDATTFVVDEAGSYELMRDLAPHCRGRASLAEIGRRHDEGRRDVTARLVALLMERGVLRNECDRDVDGSLPERVGTHFSSQIAWLGQVADRPHARFASLRQSHVLLAGSGIAFWQCASALVRNGVSRLWLHDLSSADDRQLDERGDLEAAVDAVRRQGIDVECRSAVVRDDRRLAEPDCLTLLLYVSDAVSLPDLTLLGRWALKSGSDVLPAFMAGEQCLMGPVIRAPGCPMCAVARIVRDLCDPSQTARLREIVATNGGRLALPPPPPALAARLGSDAAFEAFKLLAGRVRPDLERGAILQSPGPFGRVSAGFVLATVHGCWGFCHRYAGGPRPKGTETPRDGDRLPSPAIEGPLFATRRRLSC